VKTLKQITEELYPDACGDSYCPDDDANEGRTMQISWRMAGAIHFCLLRCCYFDDILAERPTMSPDGRRRNELWRELAGGLIERLCKAKEPNLFKDTPIDEYTVFSSKTSNEEGGAK
jgi:hypothetical protein